MKVHPGKRSDEPEMRLMTKLASHQAQILGENCCKRALSFT